MKPQTALELPIEQVIPNPNQPRKSFDEQALQDLAQSIRENDVIQPVIVNGPHLVSIGKLSERKTIERYFLIDGERRWRASKIAGKTTLPAIVRNEEDHPADDFVVALISNLQRADLTPTEEAKAFQKLRELGMSNQRIALKLGVSGAHVVSRLQLLELEPEIQHLIDTKRLQKEQRLVEALLTIKDSETRVATAKHLADRKASISAGVEACQRIVEHQRGQMIQADATPSLKLAPKKAGELKRPTWDAFAAVGKVPPWPLVEICARDTCNACALRGEASDVVCRECPLVEVLKRMIGSTQ